MPQTHPHTPERPHVGLFLVPPNRQRLVPANRRRAPLADEAAWHGIDPQRLAWLIRHYTRAGDVVLDLDANPAVASVARHLRRHPAILVTDGDTTQVRLTGTRTRPARVRRLRHSGVSLLLAGMPRPGGDRLGLHAMTEAMRRWHRLLRPGGFLLTVVDAAGPLPGRISSRTLIITAARAAGLRYHQHLPVLLVPLPDAEPRTDASRAAGTPPALLDGRHLPIHLDILAFAATTIDQEATDA
jgi:hypothetical protein